MIDKFRQELSKLEKQRKRSRDPQELKAINIKVEYWQAMIRMEERRGY